MTTLPAFTRIDEALALHARRDASAPCASFEGHHWSYGEFDALVQRAAAALTRLGLRPGDRLAVLSTPRPEYLLALMAASRVGAVYVGLNPRYTATEVGEVLVRAAPRLVLTLRNFEGQAFEPLFADAALRTRLPAMPLVLPFDDLPGCLAALEEAAALPPLAPAVSAVSAGASAEALAASALARTAAIVFTSGTTGRPKAAMLTHEGLLLAAEVQHARLNPPRPRYLCHLPVNHVGCLMNLTLGALVGGGSIVFQQRFAAARTLQLVRDERVNCWLQVPAMFHECVFAPEWQPAALSHLHSICIGGGAPSPQVLARLRETGVPLFVEYGQTETSSSASYSDAGADDDVLSHCIGRFDERFEFRIARSDGQPCAVEEVGEIQGRGPLLFAGYFGEPEATRDAFTADGWLHTGDLAAQRADGNVVLKGRLKEMIKSGGYNVYPREVELVLETHPGIGQAVVVGLADERYGESVHAVLTRRDPGLTHAMLTALCRASLANYKVPKSFRVVESFSLLPNGKIDRAGTRSLAPSLPPLP